MKQYWIVPSYKAKDHPEYVGSDKDLWRDGINVIEKTPLVTAAPEMLEALEWALDLIINITCNAVDPKCFTEIRNKSYDFQDTILKKARGES
jgi:hypothetical protein